MNDTVTDKRKIAKPLGTANYYIAMAVDVVLLYVLNNLRYMNINVITDKFTSCLWAINLALGLAIIGNFILLLYRRRWIHHLVQAILCALALFAVFIVDKIFPFNLNPVILQNSVKVILIVIMAGFGITLVFELLRFFLAMIHREKPPPPPEQPLSLITSECPPPSPPQGPSIPPEPPVVP